MKNNFAALQAQIRTKADRLFCILVANSQPRVGSYIALAQAIVDAGHLATIVHPTPFKFEKEELLGFESVRMAQIPLDQIRLLEEVDLFFSSEVLVDVAPPGAVTVCIPHSIPDSGLHANRLTSNAAKFIEVNPTVIRAFDYFVAAVRQLESHWTPANYSLIQNVYPPSFLENRRPCLDIIPGGYPKLDYSSRVLKSTAELDCVIYSPTASHVPLGRLRRDGEAIVSTLLRAFPSHRVVLRPYPAAADIEYGTHLASQHANTPRFVLDTSVTGISYQKRCAVAVTDNSSSAITFSLAAARPLIFVDLKAAAAAEPPAKNPFGFNVQSTTALAEATRDCIARTTEWGHVIRRTSLENIYNPGSAAAYLASNLRVFADRGTHADWLSVPRTPWTQAGDPRAVESHLQFVRRWRERVKSANTQKMCLEIENHLRT